MCIMLATTLLIKNDQFQLQQYLNYNASKMFQCSRLDVELE